MYKIKIHKKILALFLAFITFSSVVINSNIITVLAAGLENNCQHTNGVTYTIESENLIKGICDECGRESNLDLVYHATNLAEIGNINLNNYEGLDYSPAILIELKPEKDFEGYINIEDKNPGLWAGIFEIDFDTFYKGIYEQDDDAYELVEKSEVQKINENQTTFTFYADNTYIIGVYPDTAYTPYGSYKFTSYANSSETFSTNEWEYTIRNSTGYATLNKYIGSSETVDIPLEINGYTVGLVNEQAFANADSVKTITLSNYKLNDICFINSCENLETLKYHSGNVDITDECINNITEKIEQLADDNITSLCAEVGEITKLAINCTYSSYDPYVNCSVCGYNDVVYLPLRTEHDYSELIKEVAATDTTDGYNIYRCAYCEQTQRFVNHNYECLGFYEKYYCGDEYNNVIVYKCKNCNKRYYEQHEHNYTETIVEPTCLEYGEGYTIHTCNDCGNSYKDNYTTAEHQYVVTYEETDVSCTHTAFRNWECTACGDWYQEIIQEAYGHSYIEEDVEATCDDYGRKKFICSVCGDEYTKIVSNKLPHYLTSEIIEPTNDTKGYTRYYCKRCGIQLGYNTDYTLETKYNVLDSYTNIVQDNAFIFKDANDDYYLMAWNGDKDSCYLYYSKNNDGTINLKIESDSGLPHIDDSYKNAFGNSYLTEEYPTSSEIDVTNISTAVLYKYVNNKWKKVENIWENNNTYYGSIKQSTFLYGEDRYIGAYDEDANIKVLTDADGDVSTIYIVQPLLSSVSASFNNITAADINDVILYYSSTKGFDYNVLLADYGRVGDNYYITGNDEGINIVPLDELDFVPHLKYDYTSEGWIECAICKKLFKLMKNLYKDNVCTSWLIDESGTYTKVALIENNLEKNNVLNELNNLINSDDYNDGTHISGGLPISLILKDGKNIVTAHYIDTQGNKLADDETITGYLFDTYSTSSKDIEGYELVAVPDNASGLMNENSIEVNYVYNPASTPAADVDIKDNEIPAIEENSDSVQEIIKEEATESPNNAVLDNEQGTDINIEQKCDTAYSTGSGTMFITFTSLLILAAGIILTRVAKKNQNVIYSPHL